MRLARSSRCCPVSELQEVLVRDSCRRRGRGPAGGVSLTAQVAVAQRMATGVLFAAVVVVGLLAPAAAAAAAAPAARFTHHTGALSAGGDLHAPWNVTTAAAIAHCASLADCSGFTFPCPGGAASCPSTSATPVKTYFKSGTTGSSVQDWWTYVKERQNLLARSFGSHMVLQHERPCLFGFGTAGAAVAISLNASTATEKTFATTVWPNGTWQSCLPPQAASHAPATIGVSIGADSQELSDVLFGEVWVASGVSQFRSCSVFAPFPPALCLLLLHINLTLHCADVATAIEHGLFGDSGLQPQR